MNQEAFEARLLNLWMTTRVPLTRANILFLTRAPRRKADRWLEALVKDGVLDFDSDDEGEVVWTVRGAARPGRGADRVEDVLKLEDLSQSVRRQPRGLSGLGSAASALATVPRMPAGARGIAQQALAREGGEKSLLASGLLSAVLGPIGWIYAGPVREAIPAALLCLVAAWLLTPLRSLFFFLPLGSLMMAASGALGVIYAWQYNRNGRTTPLFTDDERPRLPGRR